MTRYYTLAVRESMAHPWEIHFGDYDRSVVSDERDAILDDNEALGDRQSHNVRIVTSGDTQAEITAAIAKLNEGER